jgi:hypothetical protein
MMLRSATIVIFAAGILVTGCESSDQKNEMAQKQVQDAKDKLQEAQKNAIVVANAEQWKAFKDETDLVVKSNETRITELKDKMKKSRKSVDSLYAMKIDSLETKNQAMNLRVQNYEKNQSNWETFKTEFKHDMDELGNALNDFGVKNTK